MAIRLAYDTTELFVYKRDLARRRRRDNDMFTTGRYDTRTTQVAYRLMLGSNHIATEGGNLRVFKTLYQRRHCHRIASIVLCDSGLIMCRFSETLNAVWSRS